MLYIITKKMTQLENQIEVIKGKLMSLGPLRPGTLSKQYKDPQNKTGGFYQLSYTHHMKSRTQYVRAENVKSIKKELSEYKRYRKLTEQYIDLSIELSKEKIKASKK